VALSLGWKLHTAELFRVKLTRLKESSDEVVGHVQVENSNGIDGREGAEIICKSASNEDRTFSYTRHTIVRQKSHLSVW
jgi:hypothetical protein